MTSSQTVDAYLRRLHRAARRLPADEREELLIGIGAHVEQIRAQEMDPATTAAALNRLGDPEAIVAEALGASVRPRFRPHLVIWTLVAAWLSVLAALSLGYALQASSGLLLFMVAGSLTQLGGLAVLVLSLVGTMWHRWRDTLAILALLVAANAAAPLMFTALGSNDLCDQGGGLTPCSVTASGLVWRAVLAGVLVGAVLGTLHWVRQLPRIRHRGHHEVSPRALAAAVVLTGAALLGFAYLATGQLGEAANVTGKVINDTGGEVRVTICPKQDCTGRPTTTLGTGDHIDVPANDTDVPDSVVVQAVGRPTVCLLAEPLPSGHDPSRFTGTIDMHISQVADEQTCGVDVETLHQ
jgi:hypothetical protein